MSPLPPHKFLVAGKPWLTRWGDATGEVFDHKEAHGACCVSERTIYLDPVLRLKKNRREAWRTWAHELGHAIGLRHAVIEKVEDKLGDWFYENGFRLEP